MPNSRNSHTRAVPRLGGIIFLPCMMFSYAFVLGLRELNGVGVATELRESLLLEMVFWTTFEVSLFVKNLWRRFLLRSFSFLEIFI